jgi:hypothetical protein
MVDPKIINSKQMRLIYEGICRERNQAEVYVHEFCYNCTLNIFPEICKYYRLYSIYIYIYIYIYKL